MTGTRASVMTVLNNIPPSAGMRENIFVAVRLRPPSAAEQKAKEKLAFKEVDANTLKYVGECRIALPRPCTRPPRQGAPTFTAQSGVDMGKDASKLAAVGIIMEHSRGIIPHHPANEAQLRNPGGYSRC